MTAAVPGIAFAEENPEVEANRIAEIVEAATGTDDITEDIVETKDSVISEVGDITYEIAKDVQEGITINNAAGTSIAMGLPSVDDSAEGILTESGTVVYVDDNSDYSVSAQMLENGVRSLVTINDVEAGNEFSFDFDLPKGYSFELGDDLASRDSISDSIWIVNDEGDIVGEICAPWAKDANGNDVNTYYKLEGNTLVQVLEYTEDTVFPVVADPTVTYASTSGLVWSHNLTKKDCKKLYNKIIQEESTIDFVAEIVGLTVGETLAEFLGVNIGDITEMYIKLTKYIGKYADIKNAFKAGMNNNGIRLNLFASGDSSYSIIYS